MRRAEDDEETGVDDDLTEVVGAAHQIKQTTLRYGVTGRVFQLQLGEDLVGLELLVPSTQEDKAGEPGRHHLTS